jgi:hypothetical protein
VERQVSRRRPRLFGAAPSRRWPSSPRASPAAPTSTGQAGASLMPASIS